MTEGMTIKEAAESWVSSFNAVQRGMIAKLMQHDPEEWREVTKPDIGDRIYFYDEAACGEIIDYIKECDKYKIHLDNKKEVEASFHDFEVEYDDALPMWGTLWAFSDSADNWWLEDGNGIEVLSKCGFRTFEHNEEFGYFFGIDGMGYDFMKAHWIPLYKARGLHWHDPAKENNKQ